MNITKELSGSGRNTMIPKEISLLTSFVFAAAAYHSIAISSADTSSCSHLCHDHFSKKLNPSICVSMNVNPLDEIKFCQMSYIATDSHFLSLYFKGVKGNTFF